MIVALVTCAVFTAFTGGIRRDHRCPGWAPLPDPARRRQYGERFSLGLVTTSGSLGLLFPPSLPLILYSPVTSGIRDGAEHRPALCRGVSFPGMHSPRRPLRCIAVVRHASSQLLPRTPFTMRAPLVNVIKRTAWEIPLPVLVIGGIYTGYVHGDGSRGSHRLLCPHRRGVHLPATSSCSRDVPRVMRESMFLSGAILMIIGDGDGV
ncbi:MAG: TRAP transporter large permease subunit [Ignavibacteriales bacterium]|nr:TRAP transporter large permease subunit [Ignavibacteriales bacterium]